MKQLIQQIEQWAEERNLIKGSTPEKQKFKLFEEIGELSRGINRKNIELIKDGVGDCFIACTVLALQTDESLRPMFFKNTDLRGFKSDAYYLGQYLADAVSFDPASGSRRFFRLIGVLNAICVNYGLTLKECVQHAYDQIKDRKGKMIDGVFVKEEDL